MVHALREAHRVLRPGGTMVDLRPAAEHRTIGLGRNRRWCPIGRTHETFEEDRAADRAVAAALRSGWFVRGAHERFMVEREMDTMDDFLTWLTDFGLRRPLAPHAGLIARLNRALAVRPRGIVARGRVTLQLLHKPE